jgi:hypothetical protein
MTLLAVVTGLFAADLAAGYWIGLQLLAKWAREGNA